MLPHLLYLLPYRRAVLPAVTSVVGEPGAYKWDSEDQNSKSVFSGGGIFSSTLKT